MAGKSKKRKKAAPPPPRKKARRWPVTLAALALVAAVIWFLSNGSSHPEAGSEPADGAVREYQYRVVARYPHDPQAYTQGLLFHDGALYESIGQYGRSAVRRVDLETGQVLAQADLPARYFGEGLALVGDRLIQLTWRERTAFAFDLVSLERVGEWRYEGEGWGLTYDGESLIMSDGSGVLTFRDPETFDIRRTLSAAGVSMLNELEYIDGEIWANVYQTFNVVRISPQTGEVLGRVNFRGILADVERRGGEDVFNGIAYDKEAGRIFTTGKNYAYLYEVTVGVQP